MSQSKLGAFQVYWYDQSHTILVIDFPPGWSMDDVYPVLEHVADRMDEGDAEQAVIFDLTGSRLPPDAGEHFRRLLSTRVIEHPALTLVIVVTGGSRLAEATVNVFNRLHQMFHDYPLISAETLPAALQRVADYRAGN